MRWVRRLWQRSLSDKRLDAELGFHVEELVSGYIASGMSPAEARRRANLEFGGVAVRFFYCQPVCCSGRGVGLRKRKIVRAAVCPRTSRA
jgi:hypothetical protein